MVLPPPGAVTGHAWTAAGPTCGTAAFAARVFEQLGRGPPCPSNFLGGIANRAGGCDAGPVPELGTRHPCTVGPGEERHAVSVAETIGASLIRRFCRRGHLGPVGATPRGGGGVRPSPGPWASAQRCSAGRGCHLDVRNLTPVSHLAGSPNLSPNPMSPAHSNLGKCLLVCVTDCPVPAAPEGGGVGEGPRRRGSTPAPTMGQLSPSGFWLQGFRGHPQNRTPESSGVRRGNCMPGSGFLGWCLDASE